MINEGKGAKFMRGLVKFVFVLCYAAFMWASIHHIATFFDGFEQSNGNTLGSYMLAGAFDITALVTTIGVMFFRKSMPRPIQIIVWAFIIGIAGYSFFMNWEYTAHFQSAALILQPTGETTPIYDIQGVLHYVPVMRANTNLLFINPLLASGFTIFSLIYSVIAEFFGTKAPTVDELRARKQYLEETSGVLEAINKLEAKNKKPGFIQRGKQTALELKDAVKEVANKEENTPAKDERNEDELTPSPTSSLSLLPPYNEDENESETENTYPISDPITDHDIVFDNGDIDVAIAFPVVASWLSTGRKTVTLKEIVDGSGRSSKTVKNRIAKRVIKPSGRNPDLYLIDSVIKWLKEEPISKGTGEMPAVQLVANR